ncbi:MAG: response regulator transcription factor [Rhodocyclaceae bacterium]|jgi:DNA-binding NarL/FixJ family response regulator|nr:response regulator transcription factor [Rhodocyclaceae bacterium]
MKRQIFLTRRDVPLPGWLAAFPGAEIRPYPGAGEKLAESGAALIWLHIDNHVNKPEGVVAAVIASTPGCPVIVLSNVPHDNEGLAVLETGASGYTGALAVADVLRQIETVVENGGLWVGPELLQRLIVALGNRGTQTQAGGKLDGLSPREREVALAVAAGATNKEVAQRLDITERTVKAHLSHIFTTLKVRDRLQLAILINGLPAPASRTVH